MFGNFRQYEDKKLTGETDTTITGTIYINDDNLQNLVGEVIKLYSYSNLLHPDLFCSARSIEAHLVRIGVDLFHGGEEGCGISTTGGSQSIYYALFSYRTRAYRRGVERPEV